jgi:eukaryotic-like serine/threonine-protein kinase
MGAERNRCQGCANGQGIMRFMSTPRPDWQHVRALFEQAQALPLAQREAYLAQHTGDAAVLAEVRELLAHDDTGSFLQGNAAAAVLHTGGRDAPALGERQGTRLGPWRLTERLGSGGMGEVWQAERADGAWRGQAAVKLLRRGMDSHSVMQRFALERQALARLSHPHIARLLDAGTSPDGLPYFVMEQVSGQPLDEAASGLPLTQRLHLFLQLTDAVSHAHRNLLVHRDLKPSNVLVTADHQVKLLDFGIAKAIDPLEGNDGHQTIAGERPFTPHYASPEQVRGEPVGTATDTYSLGVLLYLLLTGQRPYGAGTTTAAAAARCVLEITPPRPSLVAPVAAQRALRGDLDNIVLKALAKAPEERYSSVEAFGADVRAHLEGRPVAARKASWAYLANRFIKRNRLAVAAASLGVMVLLGVSTVAVWQARAAETQRASAQERFEQVRKMANQMVFKYHDQIELLPGATKTREAILADAVEFLDKLHQAAQDDPQLAHELANTYYRISRLQGVARTVNTGQHDLAEKNLDKAIELTLRYVNTEGATVQMLSEAVNMRTSKAEQWQRHGHMARADAAMQSGWPLLQRALAQAPEDTRALTSAIAFHGVYSRIRASAVQASLGQWRAACEAADRARHAADATLKADPANIYGPDSLAFAIAEQGLCRWLAGEYEQAERLFVAQMALCDQNAEKFPQDMDFRYQRAAARANLARALAAQNRHAEARRWMDEALRIGRDALAEDGRNAAGRKRLAALAVLSAQLHVRAGETAAAQRQAQAALADWPATPAAAFVDARGRAEALITAAQAGRASQPALALEWADEAVRLMLPARNDDDNMTRRWMQALAEGERAQALTLLGQTEAAARGTTLAQALRQNAGADGPPPALFDTRAATAKP